MRSRYGFGLDPFRNNVLTGAAYLREMHDRYGSPRFLAAYNAGPKRYEEYLTTTRELPVETQVYVAILAPMIGHHRLLAAWLSRGAALLGYSPRYSLRVIRIAH